MKTNRPFGTRILADATPCRGALLGIAVLLWAMPASAGSAPGPVPCDCKQGVTAKTPDPDESKPTSDPNLVAYQSLLSAHVNEAGMVNYAGLSTDKDALESVVTHFAAVSREAYDTWPRDEQLAFFINAYNVYTLALITRKYPVDTIKRLSKPWDRKSWTLLGQKVSLNQIEHKLVRPVFEEPLIHFALVCAAMGCPPLQNTVWTGANLSEQFKVPLASFLSDPKKFRINRKKKTVFLSPLLKWYLDDFVGFTPEEGYGNVSKKLKAVLNFLAQHLGDDDALFLKKGNYRIRFLDYDWKLNRQLQSSPGGHPPIS